MRLKKKSRNSVFLKPERFTLSQCQQKSAKVGETKDQSSTDRHLQLVRFFGIVSCKNSWPWTSTTYLYTRKGEFVPPDALILSVSCGFDEYLRPD